MPAKAKYYVKYDLRRQFKETGRDCDITQRIWFRSKKTTTTKKSSQDMMMETTSVSHPISSTSSDLMLPPSSESAGNLTSDEQSPFSSSSWPTNGSGLVDDSVVISEGLAGVSLANSSHSCQSQSSPPSMTQRTSLSGPGSSSSSGNGSMTFANTSAMTGSGTSSYWSTGSCNSEQDSPFINGSTYSPGYSSGGSSSGSPQSPLTRTSRPITGGYKSAPGSNQGPLPGNVFYSKGMSATSSSAEKNPVSQQGMQGWKGVWGPYSSTPSGMATSKPQNASFKDKEGGWKDMNTGRSSGMPSGPNSMQQTPFNPFGGYRTQSSTNPMSRQSSMPVVRNTMAQQQHPSQQHHHQMQQQEMGWPSTGHPSSGWPSSSIGFHAARKFGRRRGNGIIFSANS